MRDHTGTTHTELVQGKTPDFIILLPDPSHHPSWSVPAQGSTAPLAQRGALLLEHVPSALPPPAAPSPAWPDPGTQPLGIPDLLRSGWRKQGGQRQPGQRQVGQLPRAQQNHGS